MHEWNVSRVNLQVNWLINVPTFNFDVLYHDKPNIP